MSRSQAVRKHAEADIGSRVEALDWTAMASDLDKHGCAVTGPLLTADECAALAGSMPRTSRSAAA